MQYEKPKRIKQIHVPVYSTDSLILQHMPPTTVNQWARELILAQLASANGSGAGNGSGLAREEVRQMIHNEMGPILDKLDSTMDSIIEAKMAAFAQTVKRSPEASEKTTQPEEEELPEWQKASNKNNW